MLDFGQTWIGRIGTISPNTDEIVVDTAKLLRYLLLFDEVIVQSIRLREFSVLASVFGSQGLTALLRSGGIRVLCDAVTIGQTGQSDIGGRTNPLPLGSYSFRWVREADRKTYLHECFQNVKSSRGLTYKESKRLKHELAARLVEPVDTVPKEMEEQLLADLRSSVPHLSTALSVELRRNHGISARPSELRLNVHEVCERDFHVESNLRHLTSLDELARHRAIERALLAVGGLNQRLAEMNGYNALTDFWYQDLPVLGSKFRYLRELGPERHDRALATVLALPGLPDLTEALSRGQVDIERFLEIRQSADGEEFRRWFRNQGPDGVAALRDQWGRLRSRLGAWVATPAGKCLRFLVSSGVGVIPGAGIAASAIDGFLLERWLPRSQPLSFLLHSYKSIFRGPSGPG